MQKTLAILEVSQKQAYIFGSNCLKENQLRSRAIRLVTKDAGDDWGECCAKHRDFSESVDLAFWTALRRTIEFEDWEAARARSDAFPYVPVRELNRIWLGERRKAEINWDAATELRDFSETVELRLFERAGKRCAALIEDESTCLDRVFELDHAPRFGTLLAMREYFGYDEDGQRFIRAFRLKGWVK